MNYNKFLKMNNIEQVIDDLPDEAVEVTKDGITQQIVQCAQPILIRSYSQSVVLKELDYSNEINKTV